MIAFIDFLINIKTLYKRSIIEMLQHDRFRIRGLYVCEKDMKMKGKINHGAFLFTDIPVGFIVNRCHRNDNRLYGISLEII